MAYAAAGSTDLLIVGLYVAVPLMLLAMIEAQPCGLAADTGAGA
jgi:hypothetical protein